VRGIGLSRAFFRYLVHKKTHGLEKPMCS